MTSTQPATTSGRRLLSDRAFRRYWIAQSVSQLGDEVIVIGLPLIVYATTGSAAMMSTVFGMTMVPHVILGVLGGSLADRRGQHRLLLGGSVAAAAVLAVLAAVLVLGRATGPVLAAFAFVLAGLSAALLPAYESCIPTLVPAPDLLAANSYAESARVACSIAGPALAGLLAGLAAGAPAVLFDAVSFACAAALILPLRALAARPTRPAGPARSVARDMLDGLRLAMRLQAVRLGIVLSSTANVFTGALQVIAIFILRDHFRLTSFAVGLVLAAGGGFALVGAMVLPRLQGWLTYGRGMALGIAQLSLSCVFMILPGGPWWVVISLFLQTWGGILFNIQWRAMRQHVCGPATIGRVSGVCRGLAFSAAALGGWIGAVMVTHGGLAPYLLSGTAVLAVLTPVAAVRLPRYLSVELPAGRPAVAG